MMGSKRFFEVTYYICNLIKPKGEHFKLNLTSVNQMKRPNDEKSTRFSIRIWSPKLIPLNNSK